MGSISINQKLIECARGKCLFIRKHFFSLSVVWRVMRRSDHSDLAMLWLAIRRLMALSSAWVYCENDLSLAFSDAFLLDFRPPSLVCFTRLSNHLCDGNFETLREYSNETAIWLNILSNDYWLIFEERLLIEAIEQNWKFIHCHWSARLECFVS